MLEWIWKERVWSIPTIAVVIFGIPAYFLLFNTPDNSNISGMSSETEKHQNEYIEFLKKELVKQPNLDYSKLQEQIEQLIRDKEELEKKLDEESKKDNWKKFVADAVRENRFDDAIQIIEKSNKSNDKESAKAHYVQGYIFRLKLDFKNSLFQSELACKLDSTNGVYLNELGMVYYFLGEYNEAEKFLNSALNSSSNDLLWKADLFNNLGVIYLSKGEYDKSLECFEKVLRIFKNFNIEEPTKILPIYLNMGMSLNHKGQFDKALEYFFKASYLNKTNGLDYNYENIIYNNIGIVYKNIGQFEKAIEYFGMALKLNIKFLGEDPTTSITYNNIGSTYSAINENDKAIEQLNLSLKINKKFFGEEHPSIATNYNNLGMAYSNKGNYLKAIIYYEKALVIDKKFYGEEHPFIAIRYSNMGMSYLNMSDFKNAIKYLEKAILIDTKIYGNENPDLGVHYNLLGNVYYIMGDYNKSTDLYNRALKICKKFFGDNNLNTKTAQSNLTKSINRKTKNN